jgi:hypothetical protein
MKRKGRGVLDHPLSRVMTTVRAASLMGFGLDQPASYTSAAVALLDDFDNPVGARFDQNRAVVHDRVSVVPSAIFRRHIVSRAALDSARDPLGVGHDGQRHGGGNRGYSEKTADHENS